ncbi:MAG: c-type cytochrome [Acidobacteria bacterium]|nr:c-type cytochrome [Acidobacteriota bacterium]
MLLNRIALLLAAAGTLLRAQDAPGAAAQIERGRYLAEEVGKCQMCHSPLTETGDYDKERWMKGAVMNLAPIKPVEGWHKTSPDITPSGRLWERWGEAGLIKYLVTGLNPRGGKADAPMPTYKLKQEDAEALVAYLKTIK